MGRHWWLLVVCFIVMIICECTLICVRSVARAVPINYLLLAIFTACFSYIVAFFAARFDARLVMAAFFMTCGVFAGLTLYAFIAKTDFVVCTGIIVVLADCIIMFGIFAIIFRSQVLMTMYTIFMVFIIGCYIVIVTQMIVGGQTA